MLIIPTPCKAPFPYFGGKSAVSRAVWQRFGQPDTYIEPFAGSLAVLLGRPFYSGREIVNDLDGFLTNFWRACQADPESVSHHADWPINEADLTSRHYWLMQEAEGLTARLLGDPDFYDARIAGWWVWGASQYIGGGWCGEHGRGPWVVEGGKMVRKTGGVQKKRPELDHKRGIHAGRPDILNRKGINNQADIHDTLCVLSTRLRDVMVCCGDWQRVLSQGILTPKTAVFLDPPYEQSLRDPQIYSHETPCSEAVRTWALKHPRLKVALCGYEGEHAMPSDWEEYCWQAQGGYGNRAGNTNRSKERIWFSPACEGAQLTIF